MTVQIIPMTQDQAARTAAPLDDAGLGCLRTERGNLPLAAVDVKADITGLVYRVELTQRFVNTHSEHLEATYIFPLPDRAAVTGLRMIAADRVVEAQLQERGAAREAYDQAIAAGQRASIAEEERPDVFTMRVGNIVPGESVTVVLTLAGPLSTGDGASMFRFPLVVAPRYIPGAPLGDGQAGDGYAPDTDAVPDASRITPPVLLPGFPNPVQLSIDVGIDPAGLPLAEDGVRSSLHAVSLSGQRWRIRPGERADRDFVLRLAYGAAATSPVLALHADTPDGAAPAGEGTFELTVLPPAGSTAARPRDVVLVVDRSGSMQGWKMVSARRAAARIVDTLTDADRFAVLTFDNVIDRVDGLPDGLVPATDRNRFRAVQHLSAVEARGGTEMLQPLQIGRGLLADRSRDLVLVLVTDGQIGNEDQVLRHIGDLSAIRVHTVGIDRAVNAGFLGRLASAGGGVFELVESEDRLDEAMANIHRRIGAPLLTGLTLSAGGLSVVDGTVAPARLPDVFPGVPVVIRGRYTGADGSLAVAGVLPDGAPWQATVTGERHDNPAATASWARAHLRDLEDAYAVGGRTDVTALEQRIVGVSLRFGVLSRFTAFVAVDDRVVNEGGQQHRVVQPVEPASGWDLLAAGRAGHLAGAAPMAEARAVSMGMMMAAGPPPPRDAPMRPAARGRRLQGLGPADQAGNASEKLVAGGSGGVAPVDALTDRIEYARSITPIPVPAPVPARPLAERAREQLDLLRAAAGRPEDEVRQVLIRLGEWLDRVAVEAPDGAPLAELASRIRAASGSAQVWELFARAQALLAELTGTGPAGGPAAEPPKARRAFWKR